MGLLSLAIGLVSVVSVATTVSGIGVNWGTQATHPPPPDIVVRLLVANGFQKVKLFDADYDTLRALGKSGIEVMVGIPNDMLYSMATSLKAAEKWVSKNVSAHITNNNVNISIPCDIVGDVSYEELRPAAASDDAKRGLSLQSIVERKRNLINSKLFESENLLRNPYRAASKSGHGTNPIFLTGHINAPPSVSSFSQTRCIA